MDKKVQSLHLRDGRHSQYSPAAFLDPDHLCTVLYEKKTQARIGFLFTPAG